MSHDITAQIDEITGGVHAPIFPFLPSYRRRVLASVSRARHESRPFVVLFAGRVEAEKGAFDLIDIAGELVTRSRNNIIIAVAGDGDAWPAMRDAIAKRELGDFIKLHGQCSQSQIVSLLEQSHVVIVPTKSAMIEGFNKVVVEAVLAHRPYITSRLCPALNYVRDAGIEVPADDVYGYANAICQLADDEARYNSLVDASFRLDQQFYDLDQSWAAAFERALGIALPGFESTSQRASGDRDPLPSAATTAFQPTICNS
jgi:glycosyltransferase involved in cell wall biosynthesis